MDDLISRQAAIDAIEKLILPQTKGETAAEEINRVAWRCAINCAEEMIGHLPSAEKTAKWLRIGDCEVVQCSECFNDFDYADIMYLCHGQELPDYCPSCGARMVEYAN